MHESPPSKEKLPVLVRLATNEDMSQLKEVTNAVWLTTYPSEEHDITEEDIRQWLVQRQKSEESERKERSRGHERALLVASVEDKVVAFCSVSVGTVYNELKAINVHPDYQNRGIGTQLWERAQEYLDGTLDTKVTVVTYNDRAISWYSSLGFSVTDYVYEDDFFTMQNGATLPLVDMWLVAQTKPQE